MVRKKGNQKFEFQGKLYYWRVDQDCWFCPATLCIVSGDKRFRIEYTLDYSIDKFPITPSYIRSVLEKHIV